MPEPLIPIANAYLATWPEPGSGFLRVRAFAGPITPEIRGWVDARNGSISRADMGGNIDSAQAAFMAFGRHPGWHDPAEVRREFGRIDCPLGQAFRANRAAGWAADSERAA